MKSIIFGYSGHAYVVIETLISRNIEITGYLAKKKLESNPYNLEYLGFENDLNLIHNLAGSNYFIAIGNNEVRERVSNMIGKYFGKSLNAIHKETLLSSKIELGNGIFISANAVVNAMSIIEDGAIINTGAIIEHECKIGAFSHVAPGAVLAGNVTVGQRSFIGARAVVKQGIIIGSNVTIGAGAVIIQDVPDRATVVGNPGRVIAK